MAISEYSDTVMEEINKIHNEIMFLYSMLNDKQSETAEMVSDLQRLAKQIREMDIENVANIFSNQSEKLVEQMAQYENTQTSKNVQNIVQESAVELVRDVKEEKNSSTNDQILLLYKEGKDEVEIAKALNCGLGVVRLVLGLYHET
jgi:archaellum component FlaC